MKIPRILAVGITSILYAAVPLFAQTWDGACVVGGSPLWINADTLLVENHAAFGTSQVRLSGGAMQAVRTASTIPEIIEIGGNITLIVPTMIDMIGDSMVSNPIREIPLEIRNVAARVFDVAVGAALIDLDFTMPITGEGFTENGAGALPLSDAVTNLFMLTAPLDAVGLRFRKSIEDNAPAADVIPLHIGDAPGGTNADAVRIEALDRISTASLGPVNSSGLLDLNDFEESLGPIAMAGANIISGANAPGIGNPVLHDPGSLAWRTPAPVFTSAVLANAGTPSPQGGTLESNSAVTNSVAGSISGRGTVKIVGALTNQAAMNFSAGTTDVFGNINLTGGASGSARVIASGGGTTTFHNNFTHNGAEVRVSENSTLVFTGAVKGAGPFTGGGTVSLEGSYNPGNSPAIANISVNFFLNSGSTLIAEIFGLLPGPNHPGPEDGYDKFIFSGPSNPNVRWDGLLQIDLGNNFRPLLGMTFDIFDFDNTRDSGAFANIVVNDPGNLLDPAFAFDFSQIYADGTISVVPVPEPASALLLALGSISLVRRRRALASVRHC